MKYKFSFLYLLFLFLFTGSYCCAQSQKEIAGLLKKSDSLYFSNPDSSMALCALAEASALNIKDTVLIVKAKIGKARYLILKTDLEKAEEELNEVIAYVERHPEKNLLAKAYSLKSIIMGRVGNEKEDVLYLEKAYHLYKESGNKQGQISSLLNLLLDYNKQNQLNKSKAALDTLMKMQTYFKKADFYFYYQNLGSYYLFQHKYNKAIQAFSQAKHEAEKNQMIDSYATILSTIAIPYKKKGDFAKAEEYLKISIHVAQENKLSHELNEALTELISLYDTSGSYKLAYATLRQQVGISNDLYNIERVNSINSYEKKLQLVEKEKIIAQKDLKINSNQLKMDKDKFHKKLLWAGLLFFIVLLVSVGWGYFKTKKLKDDLVVQKQEVEHKNHLIQEAYNDITASINYAKRIQQAILPSIDAIQTHLPQSFVLYKPKDIVAGDFYWMEVLNNEQENTQPNILIAVADCTGHGVPGAMVSVVANNALNRAVREFGLSQPALILDKVNELVESSFKKGDNSISDGMDIALCRIDLNTNELHFSGANNPVWIVRKEEASAEFKLIELKADKQPIGKFETRKSFTQSVFQLQKDDMIYLFSDGFADQFGGDKGKKLMYKRLALKVTELAAYSPVEQEKLLDDYFKTWKGNYEQIDDVCVTGIKV